MHTSANTRTVAWIYLIVAIILSVIVWLKFGTVKTGIYSSEVDLIGILVGVGVLLQGFVVWAALCSLATIADTVRERVTLESDTPHVPRLREIQ